LRSYRQLAACALLVWASSAHAQEPGEPASTRSAARASPAWLSTRVNADPNGAAYGFEYRGATRGRFSDAFELYGGTEQPGFSLVITPLFELHEPRRSQNVLPSQYWRARVALELGYAWASAARRFRVAALLAHESDHETAHAYAKPGFVALNDVTLRMQYGERHAGWAWNAGLDAQLYVLSCTRARRLCENFRGDTSIGGQLQIGVALTRPQVWLFAPFTAVSASGIVPHGLVAAERRLLGRLGGYARFGDSLLALFALASVGNDVGIVRRRTLNVVGAGLSFAR
jgi:hypothetical protein